MEGSEEDVIRVYRAKDGWRWTRRSAGNNKIVADSGEAYGSLDDARAGAERQGCTVVVDETPPEE